MLAPPSMQSIMGSVRKLPTDASVRHLRNRYMLTTNVQPNSYFQMQLQKLGGNSLLDLRDIRLKFGLTLSGAGTNKCIDSPICHPFSRVKISSGTTTI